MSAGKLAAAMSVLRILGRKQIDELDRAALQIQQIATTLEFNRVQRPPRLRPDLIHKWNRAIKLNDFSDLSRTDIRSLCWEPDVALTQMFRGYLDSQCLKLRRSSLRGFVNSVASKWDILASDSKDLLSLRDLASRLSESDYFAKVRSYIFEVDGAKNFARTLVSKQTVFPKMFEDVFGISAIAAPYKSQVLECLAESHFHTALSEGAVERKWFYDVVLSELSKEPLLRTLGRIVGDINRTSVEQPKNELKQFILLHPKLGDPRIPGTGSYWDANSPVTQSIIEWLSRSEISLFFELFFQDKTDRQGRKQFWLPYSHLVRGTRVVVSKKDLGVLDNYLSSPQAKNINQKIFALRADAPDATAFIMDFGKVRVVEFSLSNNACYFYDTTSKFELNDPKKFWGASNFHEHNMKIQTEAAEKLSHQRSWESKFADVLASYGLRAKAQK